MGSAQHALTGRHDTRRLARQSPVGVVERPDRDTARQSPRQTVRFDRPTTRATTAQQPLRPQQDGGERRVVRRTSRRREPLYLRIRQEGPGLVCDIDEGLGGDGGGGALLRDSIAAKAHPGSSPLDISFWSNYLVALVGLTVRDLVSGKIRRYYLKICSDRKTNKLC